MKRVIQTLWVCLVLLGSTTIHAQTNTNWTTNGPIGIGTTNTVNAPFTINYNSVNQLRLENDALGQQASVRFRSKSTTGGTIHADISLFYPSTGVGYLGFKVPHNNTPGSGYAMIVNADGKVGIGTSNPSEKLEIAGNTLIRGASPYITLDNENYSSNKWRLYANIGGVHAGGFSFNEVVSGSNNYRMVIKPGGNIGIGTTNPQNKLDVKGTIRAEEVKVETGWADYVFHEDYELKSLSEVSTYIQENHHLPGIPTAAEVAENGIKLGEMNAKLLEKVEELTLYLIEMEEENQKQNKKIEALQKENEIIKNLLNR